MRGKRLVALGLALAADAGHRPCRRAAVGDEAPEGPARGRRRHAGVLDRLPGRPLLRQRLAHHRRDGRDLGAAAQARRRHLVRHRRRLGRAGHEVHERARLHPLRAPADRRPADAAHRLRPRRRARRALRARSSRTRPRRPGRSRSRSTCTPSCWAPTRGRPRRPAASGNLAGHRDVREQRADVHGPRDDHRRPAARLHGARRLHARPGRGRGRPRPPRPAAGRDLQGRRQVRAERVRRRPVRQGHRRPAALPRHARLADRADGVGRRRRLRPRRRGRQEGAREGAQGPGRAARGQDRRARRARRALHGRPARRPQAAGGARLGQAEPRRPDADRDEPADPLRRPGQGLPRARRTTSSARRSSAPATPTTRGSSPPTASTRRSPRSRSASSRRSRPT